MHYEAGTTDCAMTAGNNAAAGHAASSEFFFYQAADGQCVFLHPLVSRALLAHYGSYAACPAEASLPTLGECSSMHHAPPSLLHQTMHVSDPCVAENQCHT